MTAARVRGVVVSMRKNVWIRAGLAAALLVGLAGCGDDDGGDLGVGGVTDQGSSGQPNDSDDDGGLDAPGDGQTLDLCSLLEVSEIEAEFGERGAVADGFDEFESCVWDVGARATAGSGSVTVSYYPPVPGQSIEDNFAGYKELAENPVDIDDLGDEAYYEHDAEAFDDRSLGVMFEHTFVYFRSGDTFLSVSAFFGPGVDGVEDRLVALAEQVLSRL
jgi:hypothetical protein